MNLTRPTRLALVALVSFSLAFTCHGCKRKKSPLVPKTQLTAEESLSLATPIPVKHTVLTGKIVYAAWYDVPLLSLAYRRAGAGEYTAAHNSLPLGTRVRVTHLGNGKSVVVRITDRGITNRKVKIDLCKGAAQELGMIGEGIARVRVQVLPAEEVVSRTSAATLDLGR